jgi:hypothetical protein
MMALLWFGLVLCVLAMTAVALSAIGSRRWAAATQMLTRGLEAARIDATRIDTNAGPPHPTHYDSRELDGLPAPVQRYFRAVLQEGQPIVSALTFEMAGTFNMSATGEQWTPFTSKQRVTTRRPGFVWDAQVRMLPGMTVRVVDSYIAGKGLLHAAMLGLFTVADVSGGGEIARGEFMRFFAEAPWYPTALLPSQGVQWEAVDALSAHASIVDSALKLTLLFRFNDAGLIDSVRAEARGGLVGKETVMAPWECGMSHYEVRSGMTVPITGEAAWMRPEGRKPYFIGSITSLAYEFAA